METASGPADLQDPLWDRIRAHAIGGAAADAFVARLARDNLWSLRHAASADGGSAGCDVIIDPACHDGGGDGGGDGGCGGGCGGCGG
jgi:hypothetical protein